MRRFGTIATVSLVGSLLLASPALAAKHHVSVTTTEVTLFRTPGPSPMGPPSAVTVVGALSGSLGAGLSRADLHPLAGRGVFEFFTRHGSLHGTDVFKDVFGPTGVTVAGTATVTGGTGTYAHAHGTLHVTGHVDPMTGKGTTHQTGTVTY